MSAEIKHNNYKLMYSQVLHELAEAHKTISDNNEFFSFQMMQLNDQVMNKDAEIALLKQELKRKSLQ